MKKVYLSLAVMAAFNAGAAPVNIADIDLTNDRYQGADHVKSSMQKTTIRGGGIFFEDFQTQVDPLNPVLPAGWVVVDVDAQTPNAAVAQFTDAWIAGQDFEDTDNINIQSTSWYTPAGQSDDWIITPAVMLGGNTVLTWRAEAQDPNFPDGYEVYVSSTTQDVLGCSADPAVFTIGAENSVYTDRSVDLSAAGYANQMVHICYRNNSNDQFIIQIDDVGLDEILSNDVTIDAISAPSEYTQVPDVLITYDEKTDTTTTIDIPLSVDFTNNGLNPQSNITVQAEIFLDTVSTAVIDDIYAGPLASGDSDTVDLGTYSADTLGVYDVVYTLSLDGVVDDNLVDNEAESLATVEVTTDTMSRDDGDVNTGTLGVGAENGGYLGNSYEFDVEVTVSGVQFIHDNDDCDVGGTEECSLDGESLRVDVFSFNEVTGLPDTMIASSEDYVVPVGSAIGTVVDVAFIGNLNLSPGRYLFALTEPVRTVSTFSNGNVQLHTTENRFTPGTSWVNWPTNPNGEWSNGEDFNFLTTYYLRTKFIETDLIFKNSFE